MKRCLWCGSENVSFRNEYTIEDWNGSLACMGNQEYRCLECNNGIVHRENGMTRVLVAGKRVPSGMLIAGGKTGS